MQHTDEHGQGGAGNPTETSSAPAVASSLVIRRLTKTFSKQADVPPAVDRVDLEVRDGELVVLLGPSGCGKTTILRCVAGFERPDDGEIIIDGRTAFTGRGGNLAPERRGVGMVFQNYALWPHLTVRRNIEYPLRARRMKAALAEGWAVGAAELVGCEMLLDRYPSELSGGQQQRVALARGLVGRPRTMLFDEPLSNLDAKLRVELRKEIRHLHQEVGFSGLYVTHDLEEALVIADRIVVLRTGRIEQVGSPREVFEDPATSWVAEFLGVSNELVVPASVAGSLDGVTPGPRAGSVGQHVDDAVRLRVRPESTWVEPLTPHGGADHDSVGTFGGRVTDIVYRGASLEYVVRIGESVWSVRGTTSRRTSRPAVGDRCLVRFDLADAFMFDSSGSRIAGPGRLSCSSSA